MRDVWYVAFKYYFITYVNNKYGTQLSEIR